MWTPHSDLIDIFLMPVAVWVLASGLLHPRLMRKGLALLAMGIIAFLYFDFAVQLPFPASFPSDAVSVSGVVLGLYMTGTLVLASVLVAPRGTGLALASFQAGPALVALACTTQAVAACNLRFHDDGIAREAVADAGRLVGSLGLLAAVVYAAGNEPRIHGEERRGLLRVLLRALVSFSLSASALAWGAGAYNGVVAVASGLLPLLALSPWPRNGIAHWISGVGTWMGVRSNWGRVTVSAGLALVVALTLGVYYHKTSGWIEIGENGKYGKLLPMTATAYLLPLTLTGIAMDIRRWWVARGFLVCAATALGLVLQGESGLTLLVALSFPFWWVASSGYLFSRWRLAGLAVALAAVSVAVIAIYSSPTALASESVGRFSGLVLGPDDSRTDQFTKAWAGYRDASWWGSGVRSPDGPFDCPVWTSDYILLLVARFFGIPGAVAVLTGAVLPALTAARGSAVDLFSTDAGRARPAALFMVPWTVIFGGAGLWIGASSLGILPMSGVTLGIVTASLNQLVWALPVVAFIAARAGARGDPDLIKPERDEEK